MKQKRWSNRVSSRVLLCIISILAVATVMVGCQDSTDKGEFKVAMLLPADITDGGWNTLAHQGLMSIEMELGATVKHVVSRTHSDQEEHFRFYADKGFDLIIGHGFEFQGPAKAVAPDFPDTIFITSSGGTIEENISPLNLRVEQPAYLCGIIAGMMTKGNKIGAIGGEEIPSVASTFMAFEEGAKSVNPDVELRTAWVGNWSDAGRGKELALAQISEGVDFLFPNADAAGLGAYEAAEVAQKDGKTVYTFGANLDKSKISPETVLANAVVTPKVFVQIAKIVKDAKTKPDGKFNPQIYTFNMLTDKAISFNYNPKMKDKIPQEVIDAVEKEKAKILSGELEVPQIDFTAEKVE